MFVTLLAPVDSLLRRLLIAVSAQPVMVDVQSVKAQRTTVLNV